MTRRISICFVLFLALSFSGATTLAADPPIPADPPQRWWKGNLHTHTFWSDGDDFPEMVAEWYRDNGYNFRIADAFALSPSNTVSIGGGTIVYANAGASIFDQKRACDY